MRILAEMSISLMRILAGEFEQKRFLAGEFEKKRILAGDINLWIQTRPL